MVEFNIYVSKEDLKEVNISSLLFYNGDSICQLKIGNIVASLQCNGETRIINERTGDIYKHYGSFSEELKNLIKSGKDIEDYNYIVDMNNWFELFIDDNENGDELVDDVADIEGELDENNLIGSLFKFMVNELANYRINENINYMTISDNEQLLLGEIKNAYEDYEALALIKTGSADKELGKKIYMESSETICWVDIGNNKQILIEI